MHKELANLDAIVKAINQKIDWKSALDLIVPLAREILIFDNLVVYLADQQKNTLDVGYARAVGRGRSAGGDMSWGENIASKVANNRDIYIQEPSNDKTREDRLEQSFVFGIPLLLNDDLLGVLMVIRFGGPPFLPIDHFIAKIIAGEVTHLLDRKRINESVSILEAERQQVYLQEDFLSTISHELLTPLGFIKGYATTLLRPDAHWDDNSRKEFLTIIDEETDRLQELIDNLLDSSRLQRGVMRVDFQWVKLEILIRGVITKTRVRHPDVNISGNLSTPVPPVQGDPRRLAQVLENLISNAIKYAPGSRITITLILFDSKIRISLQDEGPGIPSQYQIHLFKRFFRNPDQSLNIHGTGLGLFICRQIIEAHHGQIYIESSVGKGTTVHIELPLLVDQTAAHDKMNTNEIRN
jgi:signal transduction histidine kinase